MKLLLLPTERSNKTVRKGKFFDQCVVCWLTVGQRIGSVSTNASVVCRPTRWPTCWPTTRRWDRILYLYQKLTCQKKKQMLENLNKKYKEMDASKKKQMLNRKAVKSRKRKISKLHVDVCIMESCVGITSCPTGPW